MTAQSEAWNQWLDDLVADKKTTFEDFARSAIGELPRVGTKVRRLNPELWPGVDLDGDGE